MSVVVWFKRRDDLEATDDDRPCLVRESDRLDEMCEALGVTPLSTFFDDTEAALSLVDEEELPDDLDEVIQDQKTWHDPAEMRSTLEALLAHLKAVAEPSRADRELIEEIEGVLTKVEKAVEDGVSVHFLIVM